MGKHGQFYWQVLLPNHLLDMVTVGTGSAQASEETVGLSQLPAHIGCSGPQCFVADIVGPQRQYLSLGRCQAAAFARGKYLQVFPNAAAAILDLASIQRQRRVNDGQVL